MQTNDVKLPHHNPTDKARYITPDFRRCPVAKDQSPDYDYHLSQLPDRVCREVKKCLCNIILAKNKPVARILLLNMVETLAKVMQVIIAYLSLLLRNSIIETRSGVVCDDLRLIVLPNHEHGQNLHSGEEF
jgi:hypothetical protein